MCVCLTLLHFKFDTIALDINEKLDCICRQFITFAEVDAKLFPCIHFLFRQRHFFRYLNATVTVQLVKGHILLSDGVLAQSLPFHPS